MDYAEHCIIRREISPQGKTRAFVNDTPVNLETLRRVTSQLMDVHSQHDNLLLGANDYQLQIIDTFAQNHILQPAVLRHEVAIGPRVVGLAPCLTDLHRL